MMTSINRFNKCLEFLKKYNLNKWNDFFNSQLKLDYFINLINKVIISYEKNELFPCEVDLFKAIENLDPKNINVIILGQDPYFNDNQANGLSFSVNKDIKIPPSLNNIFKELNYEFGILRKNPDLSDWANQNILLLNTIMTVKKYKSLSCTNWGWEQFSHNLIKYILDNNKNIVVICLGNYAKKFVNDLKNNNHYFLQTSHPSPLSAHNGFFGSNIFKKTNDYLVKNNKEKIIWCN